MPTQVVRPWTTGPVAVFTTVPYGGGMKVAFLGHGRTAPQVIEYWRYKPIKTDWGGSELPTFRVYSGCEARVTVDLTMWNEQTVADMEVSSLGNIAAGRGIDGPGSVGTLLSVQYRPELWLYFTRVAFNPDAYPVTWPRGYHFFNAALAGPRVLQPGTGVNSRLVVWDCQRAVGPQGLALYDHDMTAVQSLYDFNSGAQAPAPPDDDGLGPLPSQLLVE
jgi:hypothetical protein